MAVAEWSVPLLSFIESPKSLLLPPSLQWVNNGSAAAAAVAQSRGREEKFRGFRTSLLSNPLEGSAVLSNES